MATGVPPGDYELTVKDVPVDAVWSVSVYNAAGFFEPDSRGRYSVNSVTGVPNQDGSHTIHFTADPGDERPNSMVTPAGWSYLVRLYRPRPAYFDGTWTMPDLSPAGG